MMVVSYQHTTGAPSSLLANSAAGAHDWVVCEQIDLDARSARQKPAGGLIGMSSNLASNSTEAKFPTLHIDR